MVLLVTAAFTGRDARGLFQADLAALALFVGLGAFTLKAQRLSAAALGVAVLLSASAHAALAPSLAGAAALAWLMLGSTLASSGLAALGRAVGAPALSAGVAGAAVLWVSMLGLWWADDLAQALARERRFTFRQAVLHLDVATAGAYSAADFDRFHDPRVYREVPLAASLVRAPTADFTGSVWLALGVLTWGAALALGVDRTSELKT